MSWTIPLFKAYSDDSDTDLVSDVIRSGMNWATGPKISEFESLLCDYVGTDHAVTFNSGTSALHALLAAYGLGPGDEVIVPSFTFIATANAPLFVGAHPIFADIEPQTYGLDPDDVCERINPRTRAIIPVHVGGCPCCSIKDLRDIAEDHNLLLIEDAAEALGSRVGSQNVGTFGDSAVFSFCGPKIISTGEGGAVTTNSRDIAEKMKLIRSHGRVDTKDFFSTNEYLDYVSLGYNFRMSSITAALGITQLEKIDKIIKMRRNNAEYLSHQLNRKTPAVTTPRAPAGLYHVYQMYTIRVPGGRDELMNHMADNGIMSKVYFPPVHLSRFYRDVIGATPDLPVTAAIADQVLTLPMYPQLTTGEMDMISDSICEFYTCSDYGGKR